jgi:hypothetical protein
VLEVEIVNGLEYTLEDVEGVVPSVV